MSAIFDGLPDVFTGALGQAVTVTDNTGAEREILGVFQHRTVDDLGTIYREPVLHIREADADDLDETGTQPTVLVGDNLYNVRGALEPDGKGMVIVKLELP